MRFGIDGRSAAAFLLATSIWNGTAAAQSAATHPAGHLRTVAAQRTATPPVIDGTADEAVWTAGATTESFWVSGKGQPAADQTRVVVLFDGHALYFAFTCFDRSPDLSRAGQVTDDAGGFDDRVSVELDPWHDHRSISRFTVTARGAKSDDTAGGRAQNRQRKGDWQAAAQRTASGWTAEMAIPFELLEFDPQSDTFGINFVRYQDRTRERSEWADLTSQRLAEEAGHLTGLQLAPAPALERLTLMQYVVGGMGPAAYRQPVNQMNGGMAVRYQWSPTMTSVLSTQPDFSGVFGDLPGLGFSHNEKFVRDKRPFFLEGGTFFGEREVFNSSRIESFDVATKTFGRIDHYRVGVLATTDRDTGRTDYVSHVVREVGPAFNVSATAAGKNQEAANDTTLQLQAGGRVSRHIQMKAAMAGTSTDRMGRGMRGRGELGYTTADWRSGAWLDYTDADFLPNGYLAGDVIGTTGHGAYTSYTRSFAHSAMRRADASVSYDVRDTISGLRQREKASIYAGGETARNVEVNATMTLGDYRPRTGDRMWADTLNDDRFYAASAFYNSPTGLFGGGANYSWGVTGVAEYATLSPNVWLAPNPHFSVAYSFERAAYDAVQRQHVVSGTWEISAAETLAGRWVDYNGGYYRLSYRRSLNRGVDAYGAYTSDPYNPARLTAKLVWTLRR